MNSLTVRHFFFILLKHLGHTVWLRAFSQHFHRATVVSSVHNYSYCQLPFAYYKLICTHSEQPDNLPTCIQFSLLFFLLGANAIRLIIFVRFVQIYSFNILNEFNIEWPHDVIAVRFIIIDILCDWNTFHVWIFIQHNRSFQVLNWFFSLLNDEIVSR